VNIFFNVNDQYCEQLFITLVSILENNKKESIDFFVLNSDISDENKKLIGVL